MSELQKKTVVSFQKKNRTAKSFFYYSRNTIPDLFYVFGVADHVLKKYLIEYKSNTSLELMSATTAF